MSETPNENIIVLQDEEGNDKQFGILFTFHNDERDQDYVIIYPLEQLEGVDEEMDLFAYRYTVSEDGTGDLFPIEDDDEYKIIDEVIDQYYDDLENTED